MSKNLKPGVKYFGIVCLVFLLSFSLSGFVLANKPDQMTIITVDTGETFARSTIEEFSEKYGIEIVWQVVPYAQLWGQITTAITGGQPVDLFWIDNPWHPELGSLGMVHALNDWYSEEELASLTANYLPVTIDMLISNDKLWGLPVLAATTNFYYNEDILTELGYDNPPQTWEELETISQEAIDADLADYGIFFGWTPSESLIVHFDTFLKLFGGDWMNEDKSQWTFNSEEGIQALTYMKHLLDTGIAAPGSVEVDDWVSQNSFLAGRVPFEVNWGRVKSQLVNPEQSQVTDSGRVGLIPGIELDSYTVMGGGGWSVGITARSPEWSFKLMEYAASKPVGRRLIEGYGSEAAWKAFYEAPLVDEFTSDDYPFFAGFKQQIEYAGFRPSAYLTWYSHFRDNILNPRVHEALLGRISPEEALNQAQREAQRELESFGL